MRESLTDRADRQLDERGEYPVGTVSIFNANVPNGSKRCRECGQVHLAIDMNFFFRVNGWLCRKCQRKS